MIVAGDHLNYCIYIYIYIYILPILVLDKYKNFFVA
jgi:hypothetical protein